MFRTLYLGLDSRRSSAPRRGFFLQAGNCQAQASIRSLNLLGPPFASHRGAASEQHDLAHRPYAHPPGRLKSPSIPDTSARSTVEEKPNARR